MIGSLYDLWKYNKRSFPFYVRAIGAGMGSTPLKLVYLKPNMEFVDDNGSTYPAMGMANWEWAPDVYRASYNAKPPAAKVTYVAPPDEYKTEDQKKIDQLVAEAEAECKCVSILNGHENGCPFYKESL